MRGKEGLGKVPTSFIPLQACSPAAAEDEVSGNGLQALGDAASLFQGLVGARPQLEVQQKQGSLYQKKHF